jgi:hypothetical protein
MARRLGFRVAEVGIVWVNREASKLSIFRTLVPALSELRMARRNVRRETGARGTVTSEAVAESPESGV